MIFVAGMMENYQFQTATLVFNTTSNMCGSNFSKKKKNIKKYSQQIYKKL